MRYLKNSDELLFESLIQESLVYYSPNFRGVLKHLSKSNQLAKSLSELEGSDNDADFTFLDFGTEGYLSFMQMPKAMKLIKSRWTNAVDSNVDLKFDTESSDILYRNDETNWKYTGVWKGNRNQVKIGKFINRMLPGKFTETQIEEFVNALKSAQSYRGELKLVQGEDIAHWYKSENYESLNGSLGNSCMKDSENLKLYTRNPEVCKMLILLRGDKLVARALVWKLEDSTIPGNPEWFMDRIYTIKDSDFNTLREEANKRGWAYRVTSSWSSYRLVTYKGKEIDDVEMSVKVKPGDYKTYPYSDTFKRYEPRTGILYNDDNFSKPGIILTSTVGSYSTTRDTRGSVRRFIGNVRDRLNPIPVIESTSNRIWKTITRQEWRDSKFKKRWDRFTEKEMSELEDIIQFRELNLVEPRGKAEGWLHGTDQYNIRFATLIIDIYKCQDEWYYIELVETKDSSHVYFEADSFDGLEDLLQTIISTYKNKQPLWVL